MKRVSKRAEKLLREIIEHRNENGNCDTNYWKHRFEVLSASDNVLLRSLFKELREEGFISVGWADNYPYILYLLAKGLSYFEENEESEEKVNYAYTNNFYGAVNGVQIQQGTKDSNQKQNISIPYDFTHIDELIQTLKKYDSVLNDDYGAEGAEKVREAADDLEAALCNNEKPEKVMGILRYIRDLSVNAGGGLVAAGIIRLISKIMG